jgi:predicted ArsR family transcriptional regulator
MYTERTQEGITMTQHENEILSLLADGKPRSLTEIGSWVGISTQRARIECNHLVNKGLLTTHTKTIFGYGSLVAYSLS